MAKVIQTKTSNTKTIGLYGFEKLSRQRVLLLTSTWFMIKLLGLSLISMHLFAMFMHFIMKPFCAKFVNRHVTEPATLVEINSLEMS